MTHYGPYKHVNNVMYIGVTYFGSSTKEETEREMTKKFYQLFAVQIVLMNSDNLFQINFPENL